MAQNFRRHTANAVGTSAVELFQSNGFDCVVGISLSNVLGTAINATAYINDGSSDISIITTAPIPTGSSLQVLDGGAKFVMQNGDRLFVQSDTASSIDVYVHPSYREGMPRVILEAGLCSRPVITTDTPGCRDIIINEYNGLLCKVKNSDHLAKQMLKFVSLDKNALSLMGKRNKETIEKFYDENITTLSLYLSAANSISNDDVIVGTTGMPSRELFEHRSKNNLGHHRDFLTVGGMGHASQIALGIAKTKTLAKVANHFAKRHTKKDIYILDSESKISSVLKLMPVSKIWGIGSQYAKMLNSYGVKSAFDFILLDEDWVLKKMTIAGLKMQRELKGEPCISLDTSPSRKKSICTSRSFGVKVTQLQVLKESISSHAARCAEKLRLEKGCARYVSVIIKTNPFSESEEYYHGYKTMSFNTPTNDTIDIVSAAESLLKSIYKKEFVYKKSGVIVGDIIPQNQIQLNMFDIDEKQSLV